MAQPPPKKKRLIAKDSDSESDETGAQTIEQEKPETPLPTSEVKPETPPPVNEPVPEHVDENDKKNQPRLIMKKMVLNNFKSYAGRQVIGPFHKSFSAIVGPNGSGKSNVIDALLFVFGYRANKMRQGKLSELIHNSAKHPNLSSCSVEIHFQEIIDEDKPNDFTVVPNSQLIVSRQASRNNASKYSINGRASSFSEVTTLLKKRGIDLDHKRFLILQGEVESIALMKPKAKEGSDDGLLEYLEDIIGTSKYKDPIEETSAKLEILNEKRSERLVRVKYVNQEMNGLEEKKSEAEHYLENENELTMKKGALYQVYLKEANDNIDIAVEVIRELNVKIAEEQKKFGSIKEELAEMEETFQSATLAYNKKDADYRRLLEQQTQLEEEQVKARVKKAHSITKQEKSKVTLEADRAALIAAQNAIKKNTTELAERKEELVELEAQLKEEEDKREEINLELKGKTDGYMAQIEERQKELAPWSEKINEKKKTIDVKKSEREILVEHIVSGTKAVEEAKEQVKKLKQSISEKKKEIKELPSKIEAIVTEIKEMEGFLASITDKEAESRSQLNQARQKAEEARASMQQSQSRGKVLDSILRMRDSGRIKGIYDRLGSLGVIDDRYDVAISTACPALDNIVVETVETGQACIEYLRKNNLGRAVFTVLDKLRNQNLGPINTPDGVPRLFDLVKPKEEKFLPAFYNVLQDTLVANDMRQANDIAYGRTRWRVVTMDGKLIEKSGAMTGGGNRQMRGAMSSKFKDNSVSAEVVAELEAERDALERDCRDSLNDKRTTETALRRKKEHLPKLELTLEKSQMEINSLTSQLEDEEGRLVQLETQTKPKPADVQRKTEIEQEIKELEAEMKKLKEETSKIEEIIRLLHEDIMCDGGMDLRLQVICVNQVRKNIDLLNTRITKNTVAKSKAEKDVVRLETSIAKMEQDVENFSQEMEKLEEEMNGINKRMSDMTTEVDESIRLMKIEKDRMDECKKELDDKNNSIDELRQSEVELNSKLETYTRSEYENRKKVTHWKDQIALLELEDIDEEHTRQPKIEIYTGEKLKELVNSKENLRMEIAELEAFVQSAKPNLSVIKEYRRLREEYNERKRDLDSVTEQRDLVKSEVENLRKKRLDEFMSGFSIVSQKLKEMYQMITMGGNAELELVDSLDPFSEGIVFSVMPPKKSWKNISNLSGGEKTLSSLALVFALHHFKPTPLYVMDEIDAALDFRNVSIVANYIAERTKNAQFVIISLRNNMFELADRLVGIYKTSHCTKSIAINPNMIATLTATPTHTSPARKSSNRVRTTPTPAAVGNTISKKTSE